MPVPASPGVLEIYCSSSLVCTLRNYRREINTFYFDFETSSTLAVTSGEQFSDYFNLQQKSGEVMSHADSGILSQLNGIDNQKPLNQ